MPLYRVHLNGRNFLIVMDGRMEKYGFYTFRDVRADEPEAAEYAAVQVLRDHEPLRELVKNPVDDPPMMHLETIEEIDAPNPVPPGLMWYPETTKDDLEAAQGARALIAAAYQGRLIPFHADPLAAIRCSSAK